MMKRTVLVICLALIWSITSGLGYAFDPTDLQAAKNIKVCPNCDLSFAKLNKVNFSSGIFNYSNLYGVSFAEAKLVNIECYGANLNSANLYRADLTNAKLAQSNLANANLPMANLANAFLSNANLSGANLVGANLLGATVAGANFSGANLGSVMWIDGVRCKPNSIGVCIK